MLKEPVSLFAKAFLPIATLFEADVIDEPALFPIAILLPPLVIALTGAAPSVSINRLLVATTVTSVRPFKSVAPPEASSNAGGEPAPVLVKT